MADMPMHSIKNHVKTTMASPSAADRLVDLPAPPLKTTTAEGPLQNTGVVAHLFNGTTVSGRLCLLNTTLEMLTIAHETNKGITEIPFSKLRYLAFTKELPIVQGPHPVDCRGGDVALPQAVQTFQVTFVDDKSISGKTRGSFADQVGLHFFKPVKEHFVMRIFVPRRVVKEHHVGPLLGDALVAETSVRPQDVTAALSRQESARHKTIGEYLLADAVISVEQLKSALDHQTCQLSQENEPRDKKKVGQLLLDEGQITPQQLRKALQEQAADRNKKLGEHLMEMGIVDAEELHRVLAHKLGIPFVRLRDFEIENQALAYVPWDIARRYTLIPLCIYHDHLVIALDDPTNPEAIDVVQFITGRNIELAAATREDIETAIGECYEKQETIKEGIDAAEEMHTGDHHGDESKVESHEAERLGKEKPIVRLVSRIITDAVQRQASDIHVRPLENSVDLLYRIDGTLIKIRGFSKTLLAAVISRIKIIGSMNIAERRLPQDGRARVSDSTAVVDMRISVIPTVNGESVVIRLLNTETGLKSVSKLGFNPHDMETFTDMLHKSYGMVLVTGPTGSGKSTTLYAALQEVMAQNVNIITVENPVEYHIDGIEQIQVNTVPGYTFARALRNILRHDPDVIMIGEIRDEETGKIAIESALTGHLVLSTLHTNNAAGAITRLLEMGVEPFLLNATLLGVIAQRLLRRNCSHCIQEEYPEPSVRKMLGVRDDETFFKGHGCEHCNNTGYSGRMAVYELLVLTPNIHTMIHAGVSVDDIHAQAVKDGMVPLTQNALSVARQRSTSLTEVYRIRLQ